MTQWVNFCRAISRNARLLYPGKLPRRPFAMAAVQGHKRSSRPNQLLSENSINGNADAEAKSELTDHDPIARELFHE